MTHVIESAANVPESGPLAEALTMRGKLMDLTEASYEAALLPENPGELPRDVRAAFACRMTRISQQAGLAKHYADLLANYAPAEDIRQLADPSVIPGTDAPRLAAMTAYVDLVTRSPKDASEKDIDALRDAGIDESDIVRLAGLVAFVNYQLRVTAVLSVMGESQ